MDKFRAIEAWDELELGLDKRTISYVKDPESKWIDPFRIFGELYWVGDRVVSCHLLNTGDGLILFDTGFAHTAGLLCKRIEFLGFKPDDLKYIIHTHEHLDHFGSTYYLQQRYGCTTFIHTAAAHAMRVFPHHTELQSSYCPDAAMFMPDEEFSDGEILSLGGFDIRCLHSPGHSAGTTTFLFDLTEGSITLKAGLCGVNGNLPLHIGRLLKYGIDPSAREQYLNSIEQLKGMDIDITLDSHPRPNGVLDRRSKMEENPNINPFIDKAAWDRNLEDYKVRFSELLEREARI